ncbi:MAG: hypothetical protein KAV82_08900 [Phycisphaerae bacterium]|nr:hypothetical protein [Phycisphaerae bacterium]
MAPVNLMPQKMVTPVIRRIAGILFLLVVIVAIPASCSEQGRYRALKFFFDGVPKPGAPPPTRGYSGCSSTTIGKT